MKLRDLLFPDDAKENFLYRLARKFFYSLPPSPFDVEDTFVGVCQNCGYDVEYIKGKYYCNCGECEINGGK